MLLVSFKELWELQILQKGREESEQFFFLHLSRWKNCNAKSSTGGKATPGNPMFKLTYP